MRGRFAPSPTGELHLGNVWTAFLSWLQVRKYQGTWVLRIEDIDEQRAKPVYTRKILFDLLWLGLTWDEGPQRGGPYAPYRQQQRYAHYEHLLEILREKQLLYPCYCTRSRLQHIDAPHAGEYRTYDGHCYKRWQAHVFDETKTPSWRVHIPDGTISFVDGVFGLQKASFANATSDFVVRRADGLYSYQLAVVADDGAMDITHVVRGHDLLAWTAVQCWLFGELGYGIPCYTHVPLLVDPEGNRYSKRQQGITIDSLRQCGIRPTQILSYLAWRGGLVREKRCYTLDELIQNSEWKCLSTQDIVITNLVDELKNIQ